MSPLASASAQVKSSPSLKIVEYDVFISRMPISRQTETIVELRMFAITMSTGAARRRRRPGDFHRQLGLHDLQANVAAARRLQRRPLDTPLRAK